MTEHQRHIRNAVNHFLEDVCDGADVEAIFVEFITPFTKREQIERILQLPDYLLERLYDREGLGEASQAENEAAENRNFDAQRTVRL